MMVNTRAKFKKTQHTLKTCFSISDKDDNDHQLTHESGSLIGSNEDLLTEILRCLPAKSILRFKSVSKRWLSILTHPRFTLMYDKKRAISPGLFVDDLYVPCDGEIPNIPPFRSLDFYPDIRGIKILQSCNGLLLCCSAKGNERSRKYYVFNPTTKQFTIIPSIPRGQHVRKTICFMGLEYQRSCVHFKVICITRNKEGSFQSQIYSSDSNIWKILNESFYARFPYYMPNFRYGVYWDGAFHWEPTPVYPNQSYLKLDKEKTETLPLPSECRRPLYFGESRDHLHLVQSASGDNHLHLNVYEMLSDHSGWFVKYQVDLNELPVTYPEMIRSHEQPSSLYYYEFEVLDVVRGEKEQDTFIVVRLPGKIIRYNIMDKSFKQIYTLNDTLSGKITSFKVHRYIESLTSF